MTSTAREWRSLSTLDLPYKTLRRIGALLNVPHSKNWKDILAMMPEYGYSIIIMVYDDIIECVC